MSVFTSVSLEDFCTWLACHHYTLPTVISLEGIVDGITNTNYRVHTSSDSYILTLFEHNTPDEVDYFVSLMLHLARQHIPCPMPVANVYKATQHPLRGKPALLVNYLEGSCITHTHEYHCEQVGRLLAQLHGAGASFKAHVHANPKGIDWCIQTAQALYPHISSTEQNVLDLALLAVSKLQQAVLPCGIIHADLFRDNVLFKQDNLSGVIDLYYACHDSWAYDVAIAVNDWCVDDQGKLIPSKVSALLNAYEQIRPFTPSEHTLWQTLLQVAALRFWLSRLYDQRHPTLGALTFCKDPEPFQRILIHHLRGN